jgi:hypothetical protein
MSNRIYVEKGVHQARWVYRNGEPDSGERPTFFALFDVIVYGTDEGGAALCENCFMGYVSNGG